MVGSSPHPDENTPCSRPESREARRIVQTHIVTLSEEAGHGELAPSCPLSPHNDVLAAHEAAKRRLSGAVWKCGLCGKQFRSERHLDLHMHRKHADASPAGATSCLADECDLLRCPSWVKRLGDAAAACTEGALAVRREHCAALMHSCAFGPLFAQLEHEYCANLTCSYRRARGRNTPARQTSLREDPVDPSQSRGSCGPISIARILGTHLNRRSPHPGCHPRTSRARRAPLDEARAGTAAGSSLSLGTSTRTLRATRGAVSVSLPSVCSAWPRWQWSAALVSASLRRSERVDTSILHAPPAPQVPSAGAQAQNGGRTPTHQSKERSDSARNNSAQDRPCAPSGKFTRHLPISQARAFRAAESGSVVRQTATRQRLYQPPRHTD